MAEHKLDRQETQEVAETAAAAAATANWPQTRAVLRLVLLLLGVLSIFFAYLIAPLVEFFHRPFMLRGRERLMPRVAAIGIVYALIFGSLGVALYVLLPQVGD